MIGQKPQSVKTIEHEYITEVCLPEITGLMRYYQYQISEGEIEDLSQQIMLLLIEDDYRRLRSFSGESSPGKWLKAVVANYMKNHFRRQKKLESLEGIEPDYFACQPDQQATLLSKERREKLGAAIFRLTERERELFEFCCEDELTAEETAKKMGIKVDTVYKQRYRLIKKLRAYIGASPFQEKT